MIIAAERILTSSGHQPVADHVFRGGENLAIVVLQGVEDDLGDMVADARAHGRRGCKYAVRHYHVDPAEPMSRDQMFAALRMTAAEFGFQAERAVVVEHRKPRQDGAGHEIHWHWMVPEVDPVPGRTLDSQWMRPRHEKLSRTLEHDLGHRFVRGRWSRAVADSLRREGRGDVADAMVAAGMTVCERPRSAYSKILRENARRLGLSMSDIKSHVAGAWAGADGHRTFASALRSYRVPLEIAPGETAGTWIVLALIEPGKVACVGALDRLIRQPRAAVARRLMDVEDLTLELSPDVERLPTPAGREDDRRPAEESIAAPGVRHQTPVLSPQRQFGQSRIGRLAEADSRRLATAPMTSRPEDAWGVSTTVVPGGP